MVKPIVRSRPYFSDQDVDDILNLIGQSLRSGRLVMGPLGADFETQFAAAIGVKHAIAVNSGTAALELGFRCLGIQDREVIVPTETFVGTLNSIILAGGHPVLAEIHPTTLCLDIEDVERRITPRTAGVMMVHMAGLIQPDAEALQQLCDDHKIFLAEDAAHAHGATINGHFAGSLGIFGAFSFYPTKVITTGEGGMLTTNDDDLAHLALSYRNHGARLGTAEYERVSTNWRLPEISAALGLVQLRHMEEFLEKRNQIAARYNAALDGVSGIQLLPTYANVRHSYWNYMLLLEPGIDRVAFAQELAEKYSVPVAWPYDPPCHLQPVFMELLHTRAGDFPVSEEVLARHVSLPMHVALDDDDVDYVIDSVIRTLQKSTSHD